MSTAYPASAPPQKQLRADIQALRATAVGAVVINHLFPQHLGGGFIGVDIFFVISGYLITNHLTKELNTTGKVNLARFYARRIKRLLPAALLVAIVSFAVSVVVLPAASWGKVAREFFASTAYFQNWVLAVDATDYFAQDSATTAFQHYWSLSVEEQFYAFWPLLIVGLFLAVKKSRIGLMILLALVGSASFTYAQYLLVLGSSGAYFNTFARMWEFIAGALVALVLPALNVKASKVLALVQGFGWALILASIVLVTSESAVPGVGALGAVLGTAMVLASGPVNRIPGVRRVLDSSSVQFVGDISYGIYLWHWPMIVLLPLMLNTQLNVAQKIAIIPASILLAWGMKHLLEDRVRTLPSVRGALVSALVSVMVLGAATLGVNSYATVQASREQEQLQGTMASLPTDLDQVPATSKEFTNFEEPEICLGAYSLVYPSCEQNLKVAPVLAAGNPSETPWGGVDDICTTLDRRNAANGAGRAHVVCDFSRGNVAAKNVWVLGDSHSQHWRHAMLPYAKAKGWKLTYWTHGRCPIWDVPMTHWSAGGRYSEHSQAGQEVCLDWAKETMNTVSAAQPDLVFIGNYSSAEVIDAGVSGDMVTQYATAISQNIRKVAGDAQVIFYRDTPVAEEAIGPACVNISGANCTIPAQDSLYPDPQAQAAKELGYQVVDMSQYFCPDGVCRGVIGGVPVFYDSNHVSRTYMKSLMLPMAEQLESKIR